MMIFRRALPMRLALTAAIGAAAMTLAAPAMAQTNDPSFRMNNRSGTTINEVYISSSNDQNWGNDRLGANVLANGQSYVFNLPSGQCMNDVKVVYENGRSQEWRNRDTCQIKDFNITP